MSSKNPVEIGWKKDVLEDDNNRPQTSSKKKKKRSSSKCKRSDSSNCRSRSRSSSSSTSSSSSSSSSSDNDHKLKKQEKKERKEKRKEHKRLKKQIKAIEKAQKKEFKRVMKEKRKEDKKNKKSSQNYSESSITEKYTSAAAEDIADCSIPIDLMYVKSHAPESKEEYDKRQSQIRRIVDPETGRTRLIKGDGEILEEIVPKDRHREINKQATKGDGEFFQSKTIGWNP